MKKETKKAPTIRFRDFTDDWEQRKLNDIADVRDGTHNSPQYQDKGHPFITSKNVKDGFINYAEVEYISDEDFNEINKRSKVAINDILMGMIGTIGNMALIRIEPDFAIKNVALIKDTGQINHLYLYHFLHSPYIKKQLFAVMDGGTQKFISLNNVRNLNILSPELKEQIELGIYFENLEKFITLHQRKLDQLKTLKKYFLQNMFPAKGEKVPRIRFKGFTGDWEQRKLGDICRVYDGIHQTPDYQEDGVMFLSVENIATLTSEKYISEDAYNRNYKAYPEKGDILMTRIGDVGTPHVVETNEKLAYYVSLALLKPKGIDSYFLNNAIQTSPFQKGLLERTLLTAIPMKINKDEIGKVDISFPVNISEQKQIGSYFRNLDNLITLHQRKLDQLQTMKKFMLQNMFI